MVDIPFARAVSVVFPRHAGSELCFQVPLELRNRAAQIPDGTAGFLSGLDGLPDPVSQVYAQAVLDIRVPLPERVNSLLFSPSRSSLFSVL